MLLTILESAAQLLAALAFGYALGLGELLERRGYRWFPGAPLATGAAAGVFGIAMLSFSLDGVRTFWLAALLSWLLLGRMFRPGTLVTGALVGAFLGRWSLEADNLDLSALLYFSLVLLSLGGAREATRRVERAPPWVKRVLGRERWVWYAAVAGYLLLFELDLGLVCVVWAFQGGRELLLDGRRRGRLRSWGLRGPG